MEVTVIICTHNPRTEYLNRVLAGLRDQTLAMSLWDLVVVDNASERQVCSLLDLSWHPHARCVREEKLGLTEARLRGMREAHGRILVFVDDDNVLRSDYLEAALRLDAEWPRLGVFGGSASAEFEKNPEERLVPYVGHLALRKIEKPLWSNVRTDSQAEPWGAGMCVRREVAAVYLQYSGERGQRMSDRCGEKLNSGGDTEICMVALEAGWGMGVFPELHLTHLIPAFRVEEDYLVRLVEGMEFSWALIGYRFRGMGVGAYSGRMGVVRFLRDWLQSSGVERRMCEARFRGRRRACQQLASGWN